MLMAAAPVLAAPALPAFAVICDAHPCQPAALSPGAFCPAAVFRAQLLPCVACPRRRASPGAERIIGERAPFETDSRHAASWAARALQLGGQRLDEALRDEQACMDLWSTTGRQPEPRSAAHRGCCSGGACPGRLGAFALRRRPVPGVRGLGRLLVAGGPALRARLRGATNMAPSTASDPPLAHRSSDPHAVVFDVAASLPMRLTLLHELVPEERRRQWSGLLATGTMRISGGAGTVKHDLQHKVCSHGWGAGLRRGGCFRSGSKPN